MVGLFDCSCKIMLQNNHQTQREKYQKWTDLQLKQQFLVKKENFLHFNSHIDLNSKPLCLDFTTLNVPDIYNWN